MVSGITPCAQECKWIVYFGETPKLSPILYDTLVCLGRMPYRALATPED
jgi:hypothetical protein